MRKNLVLSVVGDDSVHDAWLTGHAARDFDLALIYFGSTPGRFAADADFYLERKGVKFELIHQLAAGELGELLARYEYVWMPDDDIAADVERVNRLFAIAQQRRLSICQPAIGQGDVTFKTLRATPGYLLRYSRFVEIMCPLFSREALQRVLPTFGANRSAWGIDWLWASMFGPRDLAVIDAVPMHHTRPLQSGGVHSRFAAAGIDPLAEHRALMQQHRLNIHRRHKQTLRGTARLRGITLDGQEVWTRSLWDALVHRNPARCDVRRPPSLVLAGAVPAPR